MVRKIFYLMFSIVCLISFSGCASLQGDIPFRYQPTLNKSELSIDKKAGINILTDNRPQKDKSYTSSIKDVAEKVTGKLLEDFQNSKIFHEIHFSVREDDDIIINGKINRFMWKWYEEPIAYIPGISLVVFLGVKCYKAYGIVDISLELKDAKTNNIIGQFNQQQQINCAYSIYNIKAGDYGVELADAFREVARKLKEDILNKIK